MELGAYRQRAEAFMTALTREYYRHYGGLQDEYDIEPIYERHAELFTRSAVESLREQGERAGRGTEERRGIGMLVDFAVEGYVGQATKEVEAELARTEAALSIEVEGEQLGFRQSAVVQANEPTARRRAAIERARLEAVEARLNSLYHELIERQHAAARELGWSSYREMCAQCKGIDLVGLKTQTDAFRAATDDSYPAVVEPELRRKLDLGLAELRRSDLPRFFRAQDEDALFPADRLLPSFVETMRGLGIDVARQPQVIVDVESRPKKTPRAFCAPVRAPDEVYLVLTPVGGRDDFSILFHEAGHAQHYAHVDPALQFEFRYLGDNSITEAYAALLEHVVSDPEWLRRRLGVEDPLQLAAFARAHRLVYLRRYTGKIAYEVELHGEEPLTGALPDRYAELLGQALGIPWPREMYLADVDPGFYCACYLRSWALETHLRRHLRERFGPAWFDSAEAGELLRDLWREGQRRTPEELLGELTGERLDFGVLLDDLELAEDAGAAQ